LDDTDNINVEGGLCN